MTRAWQLMNRACLVCSVKHAVISLLLGLTSTMTDAITSSRGSVRGVTGGVERVLESIRSVDRKRSSSLALQRIEEEEAPCEVEGRRGQLVVYVTSLQAIRETHDNCKQVLQVLKSHRAQFVQRDVYLHPDYGQELAERLEVDGPSLPQVFVNGQYLGGATTILELNESGELKNILSEFQGVGGDSVCKTCGGERFVPCLWCQGSKRGIRNRFNDLKCTVCNTNGLQKCPMCSMTV